MNVQYTYSGRGLKACTIRSLSEFVGYTEFDASQRRNATVATLSIERQATLRRPQQMSMRVTPSPDQRAGVLARAATITPSNTRRIHSPVRREKRRMSVESEHDYDGGIASLSLLSTVSRSHSCMLASALVKRAVVVDTNVGDRDLSSVITPRAIICRQSIELYACCRMLFIKRLTYFIVAPRQFSAALVPLAIVARIGASY